MAEPSRATRVVEFREGFRLEIDGITSGGRREITSVADNYRVQEVFVEIVDVLQHAVF